MHSIANYQYFLPYDAVSFQQIFTAVSLRLWKHFMFNFSLDRIYKQKLKRN